MENLILDLNNFNARMGLGTYEKCDSLNLTIKLEEKDYEGYKFKIIAKKSDGNVIEQDIKEIEINKEEKVIKLELHEQFTTKEGIVKLEINMIKDGKEDTTKEAYFIVRDTINGEIVESTSIIPTLEGVNKFIDEAVISLGDLEQAGEDIALINGEFKENEIKRKANELLRERSEKERVRLESIRTTEEADRIKAEAARNEAENNRKVAESNRKLSENTRKTNEAARVEAELNRQSLFEENEEIRNENENLRIASEKERIKFNSEAKTDELNRKEAEKNRVLAEEERKSSEESRVAAEAIRQNTYTDFNDSEVERKNNEIKREEAEALRVEAEAERVNAESGRNELFNTNEEKRNSTFIESERTRERAFNEAQSNRNEAYEESERVREEAFKVSEVARNEAEDGRVAAELLRVEAEKLRVTGEENRNATFTQSEEERKATFEEAENARKVAESKRVKDESSRVEAEKLRVTAETGRVEAETRREEGFNAFEGKINANTEELKKARSATTGEQFDTLDERIDHEVERLNKKIDVTMLQQEDKENHTIENTVEGMSTDMVIKGRTLQNLSLSNENKWRLTGEYAVRVYKYDLLKPNTKYTFILEKFPNGADTPTWFINANGIEDSYGNNLIKVVTTSNTFAHESTIHVMVRNPVLENIDSNYNPNLIILEGDWTNKPTPQYFEGIKSFGQQEDKISILSYPDYIKLEQGSLLPTGEETTGNGVRSNFLKVYKDTKYKITNNLNYQSNIYFYNSKKILVKFLGDVTEFTTTNETEFIRFRSSINNENNLEVLYKIETVNLPLPHLDYANKKDILLQDLGFDEGLRGFERIKDELNFENNVAIKRIGKLVVNNLSNFSFVDAGQSEDGTTIYRLQKQIRGYDAGELISSHFVSIEGDDKSLHGSASKGDTYYIGYTSDNWVRILLPKEIQTKEQALQQIGDIEIVLYLKLEEPVETPLDENIRLKTFGERTYVSFENSISGTSSFKAPVNAAATISRLNRENRALEEENKTLRQDFESTTLSLTDSDLELVKQNVDMDFRLMEVEFALDIPQAILSSNINFKNKKGEVKSMARTPYEMMKIVILSGDYDREDYIHKVGKYYERGRMTKEEYDELMSLMTADEVISK